MQLTYGTQGIQTLSYGGVTLEDLGANPGDVFHIWHMKSTDLNGNLLTTGPYGWGESNSSRTWDLNAKTWTYTYPWGTISTQFTQSNDSLIITVTTKNNADSGIVFDGASIYPLALHFPQLPASFVSNTYNQFSDNTSGPSVMIADYGSGEVAAVAPDARRPVYSGFQPYSGNTYTAFISSTSPDSLASFLPHDDRPVQPGQTDTFSIVFRFAPSGTVASVLASDAYQSWASVWPETLKWVDRRIIGTAYLASSPAGNKNQPGGYPTNPRRFFNDPSVNITTPAGLLAFQQRMLQQATANVTNLTRLSAQGVITWDIEGEQYPMDTSYVCSPDEIGAVSPEMESVIMDRTSPYLGMHLVDAYFKTMTSAGFRVGVCVRPQRFTLNADGTAAQVFQSDSAVAALLISKMQYAHARWGTTLFYVDSTVDNNGGTLPASIFQQVQAALPDSLIIPEETTPLHYAYTAPFQSFLFHTDLGTDTTVYNYYSEAFSANLVNDVDPNTLALHEAQLIQSVRNGDILMVHADFWQANNPTVVAMYQAAGVIAPVRTTPQITWQTPAGLTYGTPLSEVQFNAKASVPGTFTYSPAAGTILTAGTHALTASFTPTDLTKYTMAASTDSLSVSKATPVLTWPTSTAITAGVQLSPAQLDAIASVPGTLIYSPSAGTVLPTGQQTLTVKFTPSDSVNYNSTTSSTSLTVNPASQPTGPSGFTYCSPEFQTCSFSGAAQVAFGFNDSFNYGNFTASVSCSDAVFGDPASGITKACFYKSIASPATPQGFTYCASENQTCAFSGIAEVAFGANGSYYYGSFTNGTSCSNNVFGDPAYGTAKSCYYKPTLPPGPAGYTFCGWEGQACTFSGSAQIAYGANGSFAYVTFNGGSGCNNGVFGDPARGLTKACFYRH